MLNPAHLESDSRAKLVRAILNALCEAGEYDLADQFWGFVSSRQWRPTVAAG